MPHRQTAIGPQCSCLFRRFTTLMLGLFLGFAGAAAAEPSCTASEFESDKQRPETVPNTRYDVRGAVVVDQSSDLMWKRCSEGQQWNGDTCAGSPEKFDWEKAKQRAEEVNAGKVGKKYQFSDWRVPTKDELATLMAKNCKEPAINTVIFPNTPSSRYWSNTPAEISTNAQFGYFKTGYAGGTDFKTTPLHVRLVRDVQ